MYSRQHSTQIQSHPINFDQHQCTHMLKHSLVYELKATEVQRKVYILLCQGRGAVVTAEG